MANLKPSDVLEEVRSVLADASQGKGTAPSFLTAYQILDRLPDSIRSRLIAERSVGGQSAGSSYCAPSVVADAAEMIPEVEIAYMDTMGVTLKVAGHVLTPGYSVCGIYRLRQ